MGVYWKGGCVTRVTPVRGGVRGYNLKNGGVFNSDICLSHCLDIFCVIKIYSTQTRGCFPKNHHTIYMI